MRGKVLIAGASGLIGSAALEAFARTGEWEVIGLSRRPPLAPVAGATHLPVDLLDRAACAAIFGAMPDVTHVVFAALSERRDDIVCGWSDPAQIAVNLALLTNLFDPLIAAAPGFRHISLVHGLKAYGIHRPELGLPMPVRETLPRHPGRNFYFDQEDYLAAKRAETGGGWATTILRPSGIVGSAVGAPLNSFLALVLLGALRREAGLPMPMPIGRSDIADMADTDLVAEALLWAATAPAAANEAFNIANGDVFALHDIFPLIARVLDMPLARPAPFDIAAAFAEVAPLWPGMVERHGLAASPDLDRVLAGSLSVAGGWGADTAPEDLLRWNLASTIKLRKAGFGGCIDTADAFEKHIRRFQALRVIP